MRRISRNQRGYSLIEIIMVIIILAVAIPPLLSLFSESIVNSVDSEYMTEATLYAQQKMEEIIADKKAESASRGYDWVVTPGRYGNDNPAEGFTRSVSITDGLDYNGIPYAKVEVTVSHENMVDVVLTTWLTDY